MPDVVLVGDTLSFPDLRRSVPIMVPDPLIYIESGGRKTLVTNSLDVHLARELDGFDVLEFDEVSDVDAEAASGWAELYGGIAARACRRLGVTDAVTAPRQALGIARVLEAEGIKLTIDEQLFLDRRRMKTAEEVAGIRRASRAAEAGWDAVRKALREEPALTSEQLQVRVLTAIAPHDVVPYDIVIVPSGAWSAVGHAGGTGPILPGTSVVADLIMRDRRTGVYADITRTFCVGEPPADLVEYFELCHEALEAAIAAVRPGVTGDDLNVIVSEVFERAGHPTLREKSPGVPMERGFLHGLGHGVGLEVHEYPPVGPGATVPFVEGEVICIEPGLYRVGYGGVRLEDMVLVTADGGERISHYEYSLTP